MRKFVSFLLLLILCNVPALAATPEGPGARLMASQYLEQAKVMLKQGKNEDAWQMLRNLMREEPENIEVNAMLSQAAFATGRDNQAISAIERVVELQPDNPALRLALAKAYARAGDQAASGAEMREALRLDPNIADKGQQEDLAKAAKSAASRYDRFKSAGRLAMGVLWSSNATGGLDNLDVDIGPYTFRLTEDAEKKDAFGEYINGNLNWGWQLGEDTPWHLVGDFAFFGKKYNNSLPSNQYFTWGHASLGLRHVGEKSVFDMRGRVGNATFDPFDSMTLWGGEASFIYALLPNFQLIARAGIDSRAYMEYDGKDGVYGNAGLYGRLLLGGGKHSLLGGIKYIGASTSEER